jgi:predicted permease
MPLEQPVMRIERDMISLRGGEGALSRPGPLWQKPRGRKPRPAIRCWGAKCGALVSETLIIVVSIFGLIGLGYLAARSHLLSAGIGDRLSEFVFTLAIPCLLFETLATADFHGVSPWRIWAAYFVPFAIVWVLSHLMIRHVFGRDTRAGIVAGGSAAYSNGVLIGIPLMQAALGDEGTVFLIVIVAVHLPIMMLVSVFLNELVMALEGTPSGASSHHEVLRRLALSLVTHPILIGVALGLIFRATGLSIPRVAMAIINPLGQSAGPLALVASGMALVNYGIARQVKPAIAISVLKLVLLPVLVFLAARAIGLSAIGVAALTLTAACPTGVNAYLIASRLGTGQALASNAVLISTAAGVGTVTLWLALLQRTLG